MPWGGGKEVEIKMVSGFKEVMQFHGNLKECTFLWCLGVGCSRKIDREATEIEDYRTPLGNSKEPHN